MSAIDGIMAVQTASPARAHPAQGVPTGAPSMPPTGRALAPLEAPASTFTDQAAARPVAAFLAQLIATAQQAPQTRHRRRAEPTEAKSLYAASAAPAPWIGGALYRSL
jgi:hypothetical protein